MKFWDASAIVPLVCDELGSSQMLSFYKEDRHLVVWAFTMTEVLSALCRKLRTSALDPQEFKTSQYALRLLSRAWIEVNIMELVRERAHRLLEVHPLRAADALQLAAAVVATEDQPNGFSFVTFDMVLAAAAEKEGFTILP